VIKLFEEIITHKLNPKNFAVPMPMSTTPMIIITTDQLIDLPSSKMAFLKNMMPVIQKTRPAPQKIHGSAKFYLLARF